jgi:hypothetical protein
LGVVQDEALAGGQLLDQVDDLSVCGPADCQEDVVDDALVKFAVGMRPGTAAGVQ